MILDKYLGFWIKYYDSGHCETESRGAQQQNRLLESSKILKEQSSKHFLEQTSCFYVCQMNNKHCYAQVCRLGINHWRVKAFLFSYEMSNDSSFDLGSLEKIGAFSSHGFLLFNMVVIWGIWKSHLFIITFLKFYWEK